MIILYFFLVHWFVSLFFQTFFLHRYASHKMFNANPFWEKFFYFCTWFFQGASFLNPRAYGIMHRMHHAYSDTEKDPHSPHFFKDVFSMMWQTKKIYNDYVKHNVKPERAFDVEYPTWPLIDRIGDHWASRIGWGLAYTAFYIVFATHWAMFLLLPIHYLMGPVHGAIVNWCGHKYGYSNFDNHDHSKNTTPWGFAMLGELFQNNHHKHPNSPKFSKKWFEIDPVYPVMKLMHYMRIIRLRKMQA
ncbi:stearoyl-CoA desaturase (delta-9 desaturase) [Anseongella ginsenosidimutans]|uniref:Stearoyl-CoA desaturase (Delta-9 desaturase) n=1 Tax=Anseongella ginsenosidimutans TaxID=496056 RepID=A0A4V2UU38_9SPHI|nr:acyl-CoA desaturase [Anseongella ginsenosidimutans]QEC51622.1 acyl-CoA desaturase [Anseongella ginsenosidimutans]TCS88953.1 stearoyl-CoA desaturase (delta-9 desaturase) [Anseongella ginsenosidimutans]